MRVLVLAVAAAVVVEGQAEIPVTQEPNKMIIRVGKAIPQDDQFSTNIIYPNTCTCKTSCLVLPSCAAWASVPLSNDNVTCTITTVAPDQMNLDNNSDSVYGFKIGKLASRVGVLEDTDGTMYIVTPGKQNFQGSRDYCARIPGFRLIILETAQHYSHIAYFNEIAPMSFLDLQKTTSGALQWGDGSFMTQEEVLTYVISVGVPLNTLFQFREEKIKYIAVEGMRVGICQGVTRGGW